jgi:hypothetical protein
LHGICDSGYLVGGKRTVVDGDGLDVGISKTIESTPEKTANCRCLCN